MNKHEICVHIKDEEMLQQAKELLEKHGEKVTNDWYLFSVCGNEKYNYLHFNNNKNYWFMSIKLESTEITLDQLEGILKK